MMPPLPADLHARWQARARLASAASLQQALTHAPPQLYLVLTGGVDLFLTQQSSDGAALHPVLRVAANQVLLLAALPPDLADFRLHATCLPDTRLCALEEADFSATPDWLEAACAMCIGGLLQTAQPALLPSQHHLLEAGQQTWLANGEVGVSAGGRLWLRLEQGSMCLLGEADNLLASGSHFCLHVDAWVQAQSDCCLQAIPFNELLQTPILLPNLALQQQVLLRAIVRRLASQEREIGQRMQDRRANSASQMAQALQQLAGLLQGDKAPDSAADPVLAACQLLGEESGIAFGKQVQHEHKHEHEHELPFDDKIAQLAQTAHVQKRRVALRAHWWQQDAGPLLARDADGQQVWALLPRHSKQAKGIRLPSGSCYVALNPANGSRQGVDAAFAQQLAPFAYSFFRSLPARRLNMRDVLQFALRARQREISMLLASGALLGLLGMLAPIASGYLFDHVIPASAHSQLLQLSAGLAGIALAGLFFSLLRAQVLLRLETQMDGTIQAAIWDRVLKLPLSFFRRFSAGDLAQRINAINLIHQQLSGAALSALLTGLFSCSNLLLLFFYSPLLALAAVALVLLAMIINTWMAWLLMRTQGLWLAQQGKLSSLVLEYLSGIAKLRVARGEARAFGRWAARFSQARILHIRARKIEAFNEIFLLTFAVLVNVLLFYLVGNHRQMTASTGQFVAFSAAFAAFFLHFMECSANFLGLLQILPLLERARPILETEAEIDEKRAHPGTLSGQITLSNVVFRHPDQARPALDGVSFFARPGQFIAIVGPSGAGKSTLLRLLLGFDKPHSGSVYLDGKDLAELDLQAVRSQLGVVLQDGQLMAGDIFSNIVGAHHLTLDQAWEAARQCGLDADIEAMPMGMHTILGEGASTISGGQRQRILIARAIVRKPRILLFDEATSALDNRTQAQVAHSIERLKATRIVIAHRLSTIIHADLILVLHEGKLVQSGTYQQLIAQEGLVSRDGETADELSLAFFAVPQPMPHFLPAAASADDLSRGQLLQHIPAQLPQELISTLLTTPNLKIERIVSKGHCSPTGFWYEQEQSEWVLLLQGEAQLEFEDQQMRLFPGDYVNIPAHCKHRVAWTTAEVETIWLAIFYPA